VTEEEWPEFATTALRNMAAPASWGRSLRWLDRIPVVAQLRAAGRLRRARSVAVVFEDENTRGCAVRVLSFLEKVRGAPVRVNELDTELKIVLRPIISNAGTFWHALERASERGHVGREHVVANLRNGTVRHLINHLTTCRTCQADAGLLSVQG
jgi:hypothetical protein